MKLKVVGWTEYDLSEFKEGENSWAARMALVDEIRRNGYLFSGYDHQERSNCAPVFNDGKMRRFSQRGFADIMAEAHGGTDRMAYAQYMFGLEREVCRFPENEVFRGDFPVERDLAEIFTVPVDESTFASAPRVERTTVGELTLTKQTVKLSDLPALRYIGKGDTLVLTCNGKSAAFAILDVARGHDLTQEQHIAYMVRMNNGDDPADCVAAQQEFMARPVVITLQVRRRRKWQANE